MGPPDSKTSLVKHRHDADQGYQSIARTVEEPGLSSWDMILLTACMAGIQFTWTVELSYGTPYLLHLGLSKNQVALVWLAGPLSGLIIQPLVGAYSDRSTCSLGRRRPYIIVGGLLVCLSMIAIAYSSEWAEIFVGWKGWEDPEHMKNSIAIWIAVISFYFLDFSLNAVMASCRALILDIPPIWQQDLGNAWAGRMIHFGNVIGFTAGYIDWIGYFPLLGDSQLKVLCVIAISLLILSLLMTCLSVSEEVYVCVDDNNESWYYTLTSIYRAFRYLPVPVQRICNVQFFAWMGWFPFLFYSTTWVRDIYVANNPHNGHAHEEGTRYGSLALLMYSIVSVIAGVILPQLTLALDQTYDQVTIYNVYTASHILFSLSMLATYFANNVPQAMIVLASVGVPWAASMWIPYALLGEFVAIEDISATAANALSRPHDIEQVIAESSSSTGSLPQPLHEDVSTKDDRLLHENTTTEDNADNENEEEFDAGTILGIHNMYIVFPQFVISLISSAIFKAVEAQRQRFHDGEGDEGVAGDVGIVLRFGGLMALVAAILSRHLVKIQITRR